MANNSRDIYLIMDEIQESIDLWFPQIMSSAFNYVSCKTKTDPAYVFSEDYSDDRIFLIVRVTVVWANNNDNEFHIQKIIPYVRWLDNWKQEIVSFAVELMWYVINSTEVV